MNLIINASEAIGNQPGQITVTTGIQDSKQIMSVATTYTHEVLKEGWYVWVEVQDTGCGIDQETLARIFDPFFSTKFAGRGLGLAAVMGIIRRFNGTISVTSESGKGSQFRVFFPVSDKPAISFNSPEQTTAISNWKGNGLVLLVDDEASIRKIGKKMLERMGFQVLVSEDGLKGLELFKLNSDEISCVLLDLTMPGMDGLETLKEIHKLKPDIWVLITSGFNEDHTLFQLQKDKYAGFLQKPYTIAALNKKLKELLSPDLPTV